MLTMEPPWSWDKGKKSHKLWDTYNKLLLNKERPLHVTQKSQELRYLGNKNSWNVYFYLEPFVIDDFTGVVSSHSVNLHYCLESVKWQWCSWTQEITCSICEIKIINHKSTCACIVCNHTENDQKKPDKRVLVDLWHHYIYRIKISLVIHCMFWRSYDFITG